MAEAVLPLSGAGSDPAPAEAASAPRSTGVDRAVMGVLVLFLVVFPKGGIRVGGVPITWGYLALVPVFLSFLAQLAMGRPLKVARTRLLVLAALAPFQLVVWATLMAYGFLDPGMALALVTAAFFLPLAFVLAIGVHLDRVDLQDLFRLLRAAVLAVAVYGIFLFFHKLLTGEFVEIPYLTINGADAGTLGERHNDRGGIFKLTSTYNNGNLYGVSILLLLPLYCWLEKSFARRSVVKLSLLLSLSRTVWVGLLLYEVVERLYVRRPTLRRVMVMAATVAAVVGAVLFAVVVLLERDPSFLFEASMSGRDEQWKALEWSTWLPAEPFHVILEITYLSVLKHFGAAGLAAFLLGMAMPLALLLLRAVPFSGTEYKRALGAALAIHLVISLSDGGMLFIPIFAFYWLVVSLLLSDNPSFRGAERGPPRRRWARA